MSAAVAPQKEPRSASARTASHAEDGIDLHKITVGLVAVGLALRVLQYLVPRSLWLDEALLAINLQGRTLGELAQPLEFGQQAPFGFLLLTHALTSVFGNGEYVLRLLPFAASAAAMVIFPMAARRLVSPRAAVTATALFALSPFLIYYAGEFKQYSLEVLATLLIVWVAADAVQDGLTRRRAGLLLGLGVVGVWMGLPTVFALAGAGTVLLLHAWRAGDRRSAALLVAIGAAWLASFAGSYVVSSRGLLDHAYMQAFWRTGFLPRFPWSAYEWTWLPRKVLEIFRDPLGVTDDVYRAVSLVHPLAGLTAFVLGVVALRRRRTELGLLLLPLAFVMLASALRVYPLGGAFANSGRVILFLVPGFFLLMAQGVDWLWSRGGAAAGGARTAGRVAAAALLATMLFPFGAFAVGGVPMLRDEVKPLLAHASERWQPGDVMYVYYNARPHFEYYRERFGFQDRAYVVGRCARMNPAAYLQDLARMQGRSRVWVLFVGGKAAWGYDERQLMVQYLEHVGRRLDDQVAIGTSLYLYDLSRPFAQAGPFSARIPAIPPSIALDCRGPWAQPGDPQPPAP